MKLQAAYWGIGVDKRKWVRPTAKWAGLVSNSFLHFSSRYHCTPAVNTIYALREALSLLAEEVRWCLFFVWLFEGFQCSHVTCNILKGPGECMEATPWQLWAPLEGATREFGLGTFSEGPGTLYLRLRKSIVLSVLQFVLAATTLADHQCHQHPWQRERQLGRTHSVLLSRVRNESLLQTGP